MQFIDLDQYGIASEEDFTIWELYESGITSEEIFGSHQLNLTLFLDEGPFDEEFGEHHVIYEGMLDQTIILNGITSEEIFGTMWVVNHANKAYITVIVDRPQNINKIIID